MKWSLYIMMFPIFCFSQSVSISGIVTGEKEEGLAYATVILKRSPDSLLYKGEFADEKGNFQFQDVDSGSYYLQVMLTGYQTKNTAVFSVDGNDAGPFKIQMNLAGNELSAVTISAEKPFIERLADRTVVNIENSIVQTGSSLMEMISKLPGVMVDQNGNIQLKGKLGVIIMIDGKRTFLTGQDLQNMLQGMSSSNVSKVEIMTNPPAKYDASGNAGMINIITKRNKQDGFNGSVSLNYGQGRYEKTTNSINFSFKKNKFNFYATYNYSYRKGFNNLILDRKFYDNDTLKTRFLTNNYITFPFTTHAPRIGFDYNFNKRISVSVVSNLAMYNVNVQTTNQTNITGENDQNLGGFRFTQNSTNKILNGDINAQITQRLDTAGQELTFNLDYLNYQSNADQQFTNLYLNSDGVTDYNNIFKGKQIGVLQLYSFKTDYVKPLGKTTNLEAGVKTSYVNSDRDMRFYLPNVEALMLDSAKSSHFLYNENINAAYVSVNRQFSKLTVQAGLRGEQTLANGWQKLNNAKFHRNYMQIFPTLYLDYKLSEKHAFNVNLGRRIDRPGYEQMNPFKRLIDATTYSEGNPYLLPQLTYSTEFTYSYKSSLFVTASYKITNRNITDVLIQDSQTKTTIQTIVNINKLNYYSLDVSYSHKLFKWWKTTTNVLSYLGKYQGSVNNYNINQGFPSFYVGSSNSFTIIDGLSAECNLQYNYKNLYGVTWMKTTYNLTAGFQKSLFKKQGSLTINCTDIMWKAYPRGITQFGNVNEVWASRRDTRVVFVGFTYRFGKANIGRMRRTSGADDEKSRV